VKTCAIKNFCIRCKDQTLLPDGSRIYVDHDPRWTIGNVRPLYVERRPVCLNCQKNNQASGRFIPRDSGIPSISTNILKGFASNFGHLDHVIKSALLDKLPPSSREPRSSKNGDGKNDNPDKGLKTDESQSQDKKRANEKVEGIKAVLTNEDEGQNADGNDTNNRTGAIEESLPKRRRFSCPYPGCALTYFSVSALRRHQKKHAGVQYPCLKCDKVFTSPSGLSTHLPTHEGKRFVCPECGKTYAQKGYVNEHLKRGLCQGKLPTS